ncbi:MAG TPA: PRC-barrel domain-containing protein [Candidatus Thalassarchaeaceae archaeon]|jgi:sporulation protein YlmC with PRC-barrel domain|nr:PRC-barrel domain-containing protein [Candidatus Thalassarchaeaceae archaeon]MDP6844092.1 PRC-barrel domain-containing protein [Candidatus Thalassarchaeaceae archaeon]HJM41283.1 PRC-barrel domain-containing protein [Candidatus Thalassarchaeaceae archaeon]
MGEAVASELRGMPVILPDGRFLGTVHDMVVDSDEWTCTHLFVTNPPAELVEGRIHVAIPWRWIRAVEDVVLLRWFPPTPIPREPVNP